jgi:predicted small lipoprotein YifL
MNFQKLFVTLVAVASVFALVGCGEPAPSNDWEKVKEKRPEGVQVDESGDK